MDLSNKVGLGNATTDCVEFWAVSSYTDLLVDYRPGLSVLLGDAIVYYRVSMNCFTLLAEI